MEITLNSPKYAEAQSLQYQMYKKQKDRKKRKNFVPELFERYFRRNEGTTDYATIPEVTLAGDFSGSFDFSTVSMPDSTFISGESYQNSSIVIDIKTTEVRLFAYNSVGALQDVVSVLGAFNDGVLHTVQFSLTGNVASLSVDGGNPSTKNWASYDTANISNLYRRANGSNPLSGILANLKIYDNGTLIRDYPLDDNSDILRDRANGQSGTVINGNASDWGLFQEQATGEWLGQELVTQDIWETPFSVGSEWSFSNNQWTLNGTGILSVLTLIGTTSQPDVLRLTTDVVSISGAALAVTDGLAGDLEKTVAGVYVDEIDKATYSRQLYKRNGGAVTAVINKPSIKEVLNVA